MMLLYGADKEVREWVSVGCFGEKDGFKETDIAIGITKGNLIAGVVYNNYIPNLSIEMSIYSIDKSWCTRYIINALFKYPFIDLKVKRVTALCSSQEGKIIMFLQRLGFKPEGYHREAHPSGGDTISFGMLKNECKWLGGNHE
jgi:RimJ/RimL family protein N-acetyltransferase